MSASSRPPRLLDRLADILYARRSAPGLIRASVDWIHRFLFFHNRRSGAGSSSLPRGSFPRILAPVGAAGTASARAASAGS